MSDNEYSKRLILNALVSLSREIDNSNLEINEKNILKQFLEKLSIFYSNKYNEILEYHKGTKTSLEKKLSLLQVMMTDYIVSINDAVYGKKDVFYITNMINKTMNNSEIKKQLKKKRQ